MFLLAYKTFRWTTLKIFSTSRILVYVCKGWARTAFPLIYRKIVIRLSGATLKRLISFIYTIKKTPLCFMGKYGDLVRSFTLHNYSFRIIMYCYVKTAVQHCTQLRTVCFYGTGDLYEHKEAGVMAPFRECIVSILRNSRAHAVRVETYWKRWNCPEYCLLVVILDGRTIWRVSLRSLAPYFLGWGHLPLTIITASNVRRYLRISEKRKEPQSTSHGWVYFRGKRKTRKKGTHWTKHWSADWGYASSICTTSL